MRILVAPLLLISLSASAQWPGEINGDIWLLESNASYERWLVIHDRARAGADGVYHIEVLERRAGDEPWQVKHVAPHMAVTEAALRASIIKPMDKGAVYPESFDSALARWKEQNTTGAAPVCRSSVRVCLR